MSPEEARREWSNRMPSSITDMLLNAWAAALGQSAYVTSAVENITGRPARTFREWVIDHASDFQRSSDAKQQKLYLWGMEAHLDRGVEAQLNQLAMKTGRGTEELVQQSVPRMLEYDSGFLEAVE